MNGTAEDGTSGMNDKNLFFQWCNEITNSIVIIEESNHALYAYLLRKKNKIIISDVWLYNIGVTPDAPPWLSDQGKNAPYPNSKGNIFEKQLKYDANKNYFSVHFGFDEDRRVRAEIALIDLSDNRVWPLAILLESHKPSWCRNAAKDTPVAKSLVEITDFIFFDRDIGNDRLGAVVHPISSDTKQQVSDAITEENSEAEQLDTK